MEDEAQTAGSLHISDVIDVIQMDTDHAVNTTGTNMSESGDRRRLSAETARIVILEQPASKALRFRYECEGRSAGSIPGVNSTPENKTYPTIQVVGYKGRAAVIVSCVTKDPPYRPHPHNLVGKEGCKRGVFSQHVSSNNMIVSFSNLGIQCVKKKDIEDALRVREEIRVDPFRTGFAHRGHPTGIDLNAVRLCFQVFLEGPEPNTYTRALAPVVSEPIYDKKAMSDLVICKLSEASASVGGGKEMILLCEKVAKEDIQIRFYEERDNQVKWEAYADFQPSQVHKQVAISFRTPRYERLEVDGPVNVFIQLKRPSDGATSDPLPFQMLPLDSDPVVLKRKRQKYADDPSATSLRHFQEHDKSRYRYSAASPDSVRAVKNEGTLHAIKKEPAGNKVFWRCNGEDSSEDSSGAISRVVSPRWWIVDDDASPGMYYPPGNLSPMYPGAGQSPQPTPIHSPQLPGGRTPSPGDYQAPSPYGMGMGVGVYGAYSQQPYAHHAGTGHMVSTVPGNVSIPNVRSVLLGGGSCTTAPHFSPDGIHAGVSGMSVAPGVQSPFSGIVEPVNNVAMGVPLSPAEYAGNHPSANYDPLAPNGPTNPLNGGAQSYSSVDPVPPVSGVSSYELERLELNSSELYALGPWEGNLSEQMSSNLTLSETGPSCS
ncbi:uncharacterized protein LOC113206085 isoform X2 [Frankliniella occidentalis]|nr:uncharacterized protein LOC113206085 isoform X2 [Frankliniella occidentalis]